MATASCTDSQLLCVEAVKSTFDRVMTDSEFSLSTPRIDLAKECLGCLQTKLDEADMVAFMDQLGTKLTSIVDNCFSSVTQSNSTQREKVWKLFYQFRLTELLTIWKDLLSKLQVSQ